MRAIPLNLVKHERFGIHGPWCVKEYQAYQRVTDETFLQSTAVLEMVIQQVSMDDLLSTPLTVHWIHTTAGGMVALGGGKLQAVVVEERFLPSSLAVC